MTCRALPDRTRRCLAAFKALSGKARPQRSQGLAVNYPGRYHALHQPTIAKARPRTEVPGHLVPVVDFGTGTTDYMFLTASDGTELRFAITTGNIAVNDHRRTPVPKK